MIDFVLYETFSGGSRFFYNKRKDLQTTKSLFTYVYVLIFGGNYDSSTTGNEVDRERRYDYWGNVAFHQNSPDLWLNSRFEKALDTIELSSVGRIKLEQALNDDLKRLKKYGELEASVQITGVNKITALIRLKDVGKFTLTWQANLEEEILRTDDGESVINPEPPASLVSYDFSPEGSFEFSGDFEPYDFSQ